MSTLIQAEKPVARDVDEMVARDTQMADDEQAVVSALESRAEVDSLDALHRARRRLYDEFDYPRLRVLYGPADYADRRRKQLVESLKVRARHPAADDPPAPETGARGAITDGAADAWAYGHPAYLKLLEAQEEDAILFVWVDCRVREVEEKIASRLTELAAYRSEMRLQ